MEYVFECLDLKMFGVKLNKNNLCLKYLPLRFKG